uniref:Uncharacterized protein n=1 Tax=Anguilla anguilla TaxID=7936 RepID=A0A0E9RTX3_ANGAN
MLTKPEYTLRARSCSCLISCFYFYLKNLLQTCPYISSV